MRAIHEWYYGRVRPYTCLCGVTDEGEAGGARGPADLVRDQVRPAPGQAQTGEAAHWHTRHTGTLVTLAHSIPVYSLLVLLTYTYFYNQSAN